MKKTIVLELETSGKNLDPAFEKSIIDHVEKTVQGITFMVTIKPAPVVEPAPAPAPASPAPPKA